MHDLFGTDEYREAEGMTGARRQLFLLDLYKRQLRELAGFRYVCSFSLFGLRNQWISAIVYGTRNLRGMEVMKRAMWQVDDVRGGMFSDRDYVAGQQSLFGAPAFIEGMLREEIRGRFRGLRAQTSVIAEFVITETDFGPQHWKGVLREMERARELRVISPLPRGRAGTFRDGTLVEFAD